jgi:hypothetical protein
MKVQEIKNLILQDNSSSLNLEGPFYSKKDVLEILDKIEERSFDMKEFKEKFMLELEERNVENYFDGENIVDDVDISIGYDRRLEVESYELDYSVIFEKVCEMVEDTFNELEF